MACVKSLTLAVTLIGVGILSYTAGSLTNNNDCVCYYKRDPAQNDSHHKHFIDQFNYSAQVKNLERGPDREPLVFGLHPT